MEAAKWQENKDWIGNTASINLIKINPEGEIKLEFTVNPNLISDKFVINFTEAGNLLRNANGAHYLKTNAVENIQVTFTDKTFRQYFARR